MMRKRWPTMWVIMTGGIGIAALFYFAKSKGIWPFTKLPPVPGVKGTGTPSAPVSPFPTVNQGVSG